MSGMPAEQTTVSEMSVSPYSLGSPVAREAIRAARALTPVLEARQELCSRTASLPRATIEDFHDADFFKLLQPAEYGGLEMDPQVFYTVLQEIASTCMSSAWVLGVVGVHNWQLNLFDDEAAADDAGIETRVIVTLQP